MEIAKRTQIGVRELAATIDHQQFPDYSDRIPGNVILNPTSPGPQTTPQPLPEKEPPAEGNHEEPLTDSGSWSAIAYEDYRFDPGINFGFSQNAPSKEEAVKIAIEECEKESREKSYAWKCVVTGRSEEEYEEPVVSDGCLSLYSTGTGTWRFAKAATEAEAARKARLACVAANNRQDMGDPCKEVRSFCSR